MHFKANTNGDNLVECDRCAKWILNSMSFKEWTGFRVCKECLNQKDPVDFVTVPPENTAAIDARPPNGLPVLSGAVAADVTAGLEPAGDGTSATGWDFYRPHGMDIP